MVRARVAGDLACMLEALGPKVQAKIIHLDRADYPYRVVISRINWAV